MPRATFKAWLWRRQMLHHVDYVLEKPTSRADYRAQLQLQGRYVEAQQAKPHARHWGQFVWRCRCNKSKSYLPEGDPNRHASLKVGCQHKLVCTITPDAPDVVHVREASGHTGHSIQDQRYLAQLKPVPELVQMYQELLAK